MPTGLGRVIVPIDVNTLDEAEHLVRLLKGSGIWGFKFGLSLFMRHSPYDVVSWYTNNKFGSASELMIDLKLHDTHGTIALAAKSLASLGIGMVTLHASGASKMVRAAVQELTSAMKDSSTKVLAVTVLTSIDITEATKIYGAPPLEKVPELGELAKQAGAHGTVCSPLEAPVVKPLGTLIVTPGIRPKWATPGQQKRFTTPARALKLGVDLEVIGGPIKNYPPDQGGPLTALRLIEEELDGR